MCAKYVVDQLKQSAVCVKACITAEKSVRERVGRLTRQSVQIIKSDGKDSTNIILYFYKIIM